MLNRDGITKTMCGAPRQILADVSLQTAFGCIVPQSLGVTVGARKIAKAGTPVHFNLTNMQTPVSAPAGVVTESATATVSGTGVTAAAVVAATFGAQVSGSGTYEFAYDGTNWKLGANNANLTTYGITPTGAAVSGDKITIVYAAAGSSSPMNAVLLHDVDVTNGAANGTALVFGFINLNRVETDVATAIATAQAVPGASHLLTFVRA